MKPWPVRIVGAVAFGIVAVAAQGAPMAAPTSNLEATVGQPLAEKAAAYRRCWLSHGRRHCRVYQYEYDVRKLPYGTRIWWEQLDRERGGGRRR